MVRPIRLVILVDSRSSFVRRRVTGITSVSRCFLLTGIVVGVVWRVGTLTIGSLTRCGSLLLSRTDNNTPVFFLRDPAKFPHFIRELHFPNPPTFEPQSLILAPRDRVSSPSPFSRHPKA